MDPSYRKLILREFVLECNKCGREICQSSDQNYCQYCGSYIGSQCPPIQENSTPKIEQLESIPWENNESTGFFPSLIQTSRLILLNPSSFFKRMPISGGINQPMWYALVMETLGAVLGYIWSIVFGNASTLSVGNIGKLVVLALSIPFLIFVSLVIWAGLTHISVKLLSSSKSDFESTLRIICYSSASEVFSLIPVMGGVINAIYKMYLVGFGLKEIHNLTTGKAVLAIILPIFVCCSLPILGAAFFILMVFEKAF